MTDYALAKGVIPSLDGFRALAIAVVFAGHARLFPGIPGGFGVTVFFFLSGFLITTLLIREYDRYGSIAFPAFFARRVVRLLPPLLATLLGAAVLVQLGYATGALDPNTILSQIFFYFNYFKIYGDAENNVKGFIILWSLSIEEHFYFVWPFMFWLIARQKFDLRLIIALLIILPLWRYYRYMVWLDPEWVIYSLTDTRFDSLLYGCFLAILQRRGLAERLFPDQSRTRMLLLGGAVLVILATFVVREPTFRSTLRYTLQGLVLMPVFHYAVMRPDLWCFRPFNWGWVSWLGLMSYTFYICHFVLIFVFREQGLFESNYPLFVLLAGGSALMWSAVVYYGLERPLKPLRSRLTGHSPQHTLAEK